MGIPSKQTNIIGVRRFAYVKKKEELDLIEIVSTTRFTRFNSFIAWNVFTTSVRIKVKLVDKMMQSTYLRVILHFKHKKLPIHAVFTWFLILGKKITAQMATFGDVTGLQQCHQQ